MMATVLKPIPVPWMVSATMCGLTLTHREPDVWPECSVVFGADRRGDDGRKEICRVAIEFSACYFVRTAPKKDDDSIESSGFSLVRDFRGDIYDYLGWLDATWRATGNCPSSGFYVATHSEWLETFSDRYRRETRHYVIAGRDSYIELIATGFTWKVWPWPSGLRDDAPLNHPVVDSGEGVC